MIKQTVGIPLMAALLGACVTINIYFPAAAAEEAARTIVRDVLKEGQSEPAPAEPAPAEPAPAEPAGDGQSALDDAGVLMIAFGQLFERLVPAAHAAQADINIDTAAIRAVRASIKQRQSALAPFYRAGAIGFDNRGSVDIRDLAAASLAERNRLKKLVADENADRARLYREIAHANGHPEWEGDVRATFARVWVDEAPPGYWYQDSAGTWRQR